MELISLLLVFKEIGVGEGGGIGTLGRILIISLLQETPENPPVRFHIERNLSAA